LPDLLQPNNLRHSFQAPTLIGCQIFKEQGEDCIARDSC